MKSESEISESESDHIVKQVMTQAMGKEGIEKAIQNELRSKAKERASLR